MQFRISDGAVVDSCGKKGIGDGELSGPVGLALVRGTEQAGSSSALPGDDALAAGNGDRLYVVDSGNNRICIFGVSPLRFLTSINKKGSEPLELWPLIGFVVYAGCLYVSDFANNRVQVLTLSGEFLRSIDINYTPNSIAVRPDGRLLVGSAGGRRIELRTLFGSLLQVRPTHVYAAHVLCMAASYCCVHPPLASSLDEYSYWFARTFATKVPPVWRESDHTRVWSHSAACHHCK